MASPIVLKCRTGSSNLHSIKDLDTSSTLLDLKAFILSLTGFDYDKLVLKSGFPPTIIEGDDGLLLTDCGINSGDLIIVEQLRSPGGAAPKPGKRSAPAPIYSDASKKSVKEDLSIKRKPVPANNSCLFTSIDYCVNGKLDQQNAASIRRAVADIILSNPQKYSEALLGKPPEDYATWVKNPRTWGGGIELSILCDYYTMEIDVVDIQNTRIEKFGEQHDNRILLIYDGIHYDPLYQGDNSKPRTIFSTRDDDVLARALVLAEKEKADRKYTDSKSFKLQCLVCGQGLRGEQELSRHAQETSHTNFKEY